MKYFLLSVSGFIMIVLMIASIFYYQDQKETPYSPMSQVNDISNNQKATIEAEQSKSQALQKPDEQIGYTLQNNVLNITFNKGEDWTTVPVEMEQLFSGEYNGNKQELIENSYILTENRAAFLYSEGENWDHQKILLTYSTDQGETWEKSVVTEPFTVMRFRKVEFLNEILVISLFLVVVRCPKNLHTSFSHTMVERVGRKPLILV